MPLANTIVRPALSMDVLVWGSVILNNDEGEAFLLRNHNKMLATTTAKPVVNAMDQNGDGDEYIGTNRHLHVPPRYLHEYRCKGLNMFRSVLKTLGNVMKSYEQL